MNLLAPRLRAQGSANRPSIVAFHHFCFGSFSEVSARVGDFRSTLSIGRQASERPFPKSANNGSDHFGVLGLRVAAASCHSGKQEQTSKRSVRQHVAILPVTGAIGPV